MHAKQQLVLARSPGASPTSNPAAYQNFINQQMYAGADVAYGGLADPFQAAQIPSGYYFNDGWHPIFGGDAVLVANAFGVGDIPTVSTPSKDGLTPANNGTPPANNSTSSALLKTVNAMFNRPWVLSWIVPIVGAPVVAGIGPAAI